MGLLGAENLRTIFTKTDHWLYIFIYYGGYQLELLSFQWLSKNHGNLKTRSGRES
ncbi:hypothetical protein [Lysinibacillus sphaericus]|uniref:hypothetical protein n=1 Tax=Lysinibacillus sphaericus TaxID=1421 RepID=UPI000AAB0B31|nr:hypothetical protein [Lysinibacillus sphaericus]